MAIDSPVRCRKCNRPLLLLRLDTKNVSIICPWCQHKQIPKIDIEPEELHQPWNRKSD